MLSRIFRFIIFSYQPVETIFSRIASLLIMIMMLLTAADVFGRYVLNSPIQGAYDITESMIVGMIFLGIAYVQSRKGHVKVEVATLWMPKRAQMGLDIFAYFLGFVMFVLVTWRSGYFAWEAFVTGDNTGGIVKVPFWPAKSLFTIGSGLMAIQFLADIITDTTRLIRGDKSQ